ncbi:hypothetical protein ACHAW6_010852 [Cyclotella cf. meneghiniana]
MKRRPLELVCLLAWAQTSNGFAIAIGRPFRTDTGTGTIPSTRLFSRSSVPITEDQYPRFLSSASLCANSDSCSIDAAESYLREIVRIESACVAGTVSGDSICKDVGRVSEVVAGLREKIRRGAKQEIKTFWQQRQEEFQNLVSSSIDHRSNDMSPLAAFTQAPIKPAYLAIAALYTMAVISLFQPAEMDPGTLSGVVPFTTQEVWWAIRDGYVVDLMSAWLKNGGLVLSDEIVAASSLMPREVWWSIRDGYSSNLLF